MRFTGLVTQGASRMGSSEFIKAFKVASSLDGRSYTVFRAEGENSDHVSAASVPPHPPHALGNSVHSLLVSVQVFPGNVDNDGTKTHLFDPPIIAQYVRLLPLVCRRACTLRMELVGCELNGATDRLPHCR